MTVDSVELLSFEKCTANQREPTVLQGFLPKAETKCAAITVDGV